VRRFLRILVILGLLIPGPWTAGSAQQLVGRLLKVEDQSPIAGALVLLMNAERQEVGRTATTGSGGFTLQAPAPGRYTLRVLRIGSLAWWSPPLDLVQGERRELRLSLESNPVQLPDYEIRAAGNRCGIRSGGSDVFARLLTEAEKALALAQQSIRDGMLRYRTETWQVRPDRDGVPGERERSSALTIATWPMQSAPPESLATWGFVHEGPPYGVPPEIVTERGPVYYAPDARVLFAEWFLDRHCFSVDADSADSSIVVLRFVPIPERGRIDVSGSLRINRQSLELRSLRFRYTGLGSWVPPDSAGGELVFSRLRSGAWIVDRWSIRAPIPILRPGRSQPGFFGFAESGGRVLEVQWGRYGEIERIS
jgi:hypothetical protein